jgi:hypothetical protein
MTLTTSQNSPPPGVVSRPPGKSLAIPTQGRHHTFDEIADLVLTNSLCGSSVEVLCLTQELLESWLHWLEQFPATAMLPEVLNANQATLGDWREYLGGQHYDITIFHGHWAELRANRLSVDYVTGLVNAVPTGMVVLA